MPSVVVRVEIKRAGSKQADARVAEIRPIALCFHAKHPLVGLPTVADLAADDTSGPRGAAVSEVKAKRINEIQAAVALTPAAVAADVEAGPVVNQGPQRRRAVVP